MSGRWHARDAGGKLLSHDDWTVRHKPTDDKIASGVASVVVLNDDGEAVAILVEPVSIFVIGDDEACADLERRLGDRADLIAAAPALFEALTWFLEDERFQVAVGGNPNVVDRMIAQARAALALARGRS